MITFPAVEPGEPVVVSATAFLAHIDCPDQALARLRGEYPADSNESFRGGLAHRIFARHLVAGPIERADMGRVCREEIGAAMNQKVVALSMRPSRLNALIGEIGELYATFKRFPTAGFREAEVFIEVTPAEGITLRGSIDATFDDEGGVRLVDWKTGDLGAAQHQLSFYALLWGLEKGTLPVLVEAMSVRTGERHAETPTIDSVHRTAGLVAAMVGMQRRALAADDWIERVAGGWCRFCPILEGCQEGSAAVAIWS